MLTPEQVARIAARAAAIADPDQREDYVLRASRSLLRLCDRCGRVIEEGYVIQGGSRHYCGDPCLRAAVADGQEPADLLEALEHADEDEEDENYYTMWNE